MKIVILGRGDLLYKVASYFSTIDEFLIVGIYTAKAAPEYKYTESHFEELANRLGCRFHCASKINREGLLNFLQHETADIALSINFPTLVPEDVISQFRLGVLNVHGGDLPRYKGNACQAWAILNGEDRIALCIHKMEGGRLDHGDIIAREYFPLQKGTRIGECYAWMDAIICDLFKEALQNLRNDPYYFLDKPSSDPANGLRCYPRRPEDGLIDWLIGADHIERLINASSEPYSGAFTYLEGERLIIWRAESIRAEEPFLAVPGQIAMIAPTGFVDVCCTDNMYLRLHEVEMRGKRGLPAQFIKSIRQRLTRI